MKQQPAGKGSARLFDLVAPVYGCSFRFQYRHYLEIYQRQTVREMLNGSRSILDIGCGTGAMARALCDSGFHLTGVDASLGMLRQAKRLTKAETPLCVLSDANRGLPFVEKTFDICLASYVAHGLKSPERKALYGEMRRLAGNLVILHDYTEKRSLITNFVEWIEDGDYFNFIKVIRQELLDYFGNLQVIPVEPRAALYVCRV